MSRAADLLEHRAPSIAVTMTEENGAAASWARFDVHVAVGIMGEAAVQAYRLVGEVLLSGVPGLRATAVRRPVGVVVGIAPWNAPLVLSGMGFGLLIGALPAVAVNPVPIELSGTASAVTTLLRGFGQALGPAVIGTVALTSAGNAPAQALPHAGPAAAQQHAVQAVAAEGGPLAVAPAPVGPRVGALVTEALTHGYDLGFLVTALACPVAAAISVLFLRGGHSSGQGVPLP